jgi:transcriptional regulator with XRE-family HTH domain
MSKIADTLRRSIKTSDLSQTQIAAGVGVAPSTITRFTAGGTIDVELAERLAEFLGLRITILRTPKKKK